MAKFKKINIINDTTIIKGIFDFHPTIWYSGSEYIRYNNDFKSIEWSHPYIPTFAKKWNETTLLIHSNNNISLLNKKTGEAKIIIEIKGDYGEIKNKYFFLYDEKLGKRYYDYNFNPLNIPMKEWKENHEVSWTDDYFLKSPKNRLEDGSLHLKQIDFHSWRGEYISTLSFETLENQVIEGLEMPKNLGVSTLNTNLIHKGIYMTNLCSEDENERACLVGVEIKTGKIIWTSTKVHVNRYTTIYKDQFIHNVLDKIIFTDVFSGKTIKEIQIDKEKKLPFTFSIWKSIFSFTPIKDSIWAGVELDTYTVVAFDINTGEVVWYEQLKGDEGAYGFQVEPKVYCHENRLYVISRQFAGKETGIFRGSRLHVYEMEE